MKIHRSPPRKIKCETDLKTLEKLIFEFFSLKLPRYEAAKDDS